jgi:hypothetical protein
MPAPLFDNKIQNLVKRGVETATKDVTTGFNIKMSDIKDLNLNWKSISGSFNDEFNTRNNKLYIMSARKLQTTDDFIIIKFKNNDIDKPFGSVWNNSIVLDDEWYSVTELYRWEGVLEPITLPLIDVKTGKVVNWNDITLFQKGISFSIDNDKNSYWLKTYQLVTNGQVKVKMENTNIETVKVSGKKIPQINKVWEFDLPIDNTTVENKDYKIEVVFTIDKKSYVGQIIVSSLLSQPSINVKKNTSVIGNVDSYVYQILTNGKVGVTTLTSDLYYSDTEVKISLNKPTVSTNITAQIFGLDEKWEKNKNVYQIFYSQTYNLDGSQLKTYQGRYLIETGYNSKKKSSYYVVVNKNNLTPNFWDTQQGQQFYDLASLNGYNESIKKLNATELNKIINESKNWQQLASDSQIATAVSDWFKINCKLLSKELLTKEQIIEQLKKQIPNNIKINRVNISNYDVNKVGFELNLNEVKPNEKVNIIVKYNNATSEQFILQIKDSNIPDNNKKSGLTDLAIFGIVLGSLAGLAILGWLLKSLVVNPFILGPIREKKQKARRIREDKMIAEIQAEEAEKEKRGK